MARFSINDFAAEIHKNTGLARPNKYRVSIPFPLAKAKDSDEIPPPSINPIFCHSATLPGRSIESATYDIGRGKEYQIASKIAYENVDFSFYITNNNWYERNIFDLWLDNIINPINDYVKYKNTYTREVSIDCYNEHDDRTYGVKLINSFPLSINEVELSGESHEPVSVTVSLAYDRWERVFPRRASTKRMGPIL